MYIQEAVKKAMEEDRYIIMESAMGYLKIKPTDGDGLCILMTADGSRQHKCWNPSASDLMRDDWHVID